MDYLWAPWRMNYIQNVDEKKGGCVFCELQEEKKDKDNLILFRGRNNFVIMNLYPYNNGHLLIVPFAHVADCTLLEDQVSSELWRLLCRCKKILASAFHPDGFNIGMNIGRASGAGIDQHIHMHIVPRWNGDTNFMPVTAATKVISQSLAEGYDQLIPYFIAMAEI
jgi:ATP adenylyltransferase